jgi:mono/diheme cytochrome c family protein
MKTKLTLLWLACLSLCLFAIRCQDAEAGCRVATRSFVHSNVVHSAKVHQPFVATTFAVPVGVPVSYTTPVAPFAPYWYSSAAYIQQQQQAATAHSDGLEASGGRNAPLVLFNGKCVRCHSGEKPKAGLDLSDPANLDPETKLKAVRAVLDERMPKGGKLSAVEAGQVLDVLSRESEVSK